MHRVFLAINLPEEVKDKIHHEVEHYLRPLFAPGVRFADPDNWHITLAFYGGRDDQAVHELTQEMNKIAPKIKAPRIKLEKIVYGPLPRPGLHNERPGDRGGKNQNMIWLVGSKETDRGLQKIHDQFQDSYKSFTTHITLLRFGNIPNFPRVLPEIEKKISLEFTAEGLDLMESTLHHLGSRYAKLYSVPFAGIINN